MRRNLVLWFASKLDKTMDGEDLERALKLAVSAHFGQRDKSGAPYILHVLDVWQSMRNMDIEHQIVALLHDVVEDTHVTVRSIRNAFGPEIAASVDAITKRKEEDRDAYLQRVKSNSVAWVVKVADSADNYRRLKNLPNAKERKRLKAKYEHVFEVLRPRPKLRETENG